MQYGNTKMDNVLSERKICLNRTMQYGNISIHYFIDTEDKVFKSYYVVWKRLYGIVDPPDAESLNRTMQYGNISPEIRVEISDEV